MSHSIVTKRGDRGLSDLQHGPQQPKTSPIFEAIGRVYELNCLLGTMDESQVDLSRVRHRLFDIGAALSKPEDTPMTDEIDWLEANVRRMEANLPVLTNFILPGGPGALLFLAGAVCRNAERAVWAIQFENVACYLNRLSDYFFIYGRTVNYLAQHQDVIWRK
jgi:cob(I)alamin adenosyltransferase